jgi:hypothetical protein
MTKKCFRSWLFCTVALASGAISAQSHPSSPAAELRLRIALSQTGKGRSVPAVIWLEPVGGTPNKPFLPKGSYTLLQKNRMFIPHLQVIPVGAVVQFPNVDPFFHNVFSLFEGKRFDLGLYEAGSSKSVTFSREGVSYIFCNIHPEMSAVVLSLSSSLYTIADTNNAFLLRDIPTGDYNLHLWVEGVSPPVLDRLTRPLHLSSGTLNLGALSIPTTPLVNATHENKFGNPYDPNSKSPYER